MDLRELKLAMEAAWAAGFDGEVPTWWLPNAGPVIKMERGSLEGFIFQNPTHVIVAFQGTDWNEYGDVLTDLNFDKVRLSGIPGKWHEGFVRGAGKFWVHILIWLRANLGDRKLLVTGFSLGSALAQASSIYMSQARYDHTVYSFGGPRIANRRAARWLHDRVEHHRVYTPGDPVKHLPPWFLGFKHIGRHRVIGEKRHGHNRDEYTLLVRDL
jgi:hypothetical protein